MCVRATPRSEPGMPVSGLETSELSTRDVPGNRSGRVRFAGILVILIGAFNVIQGIAAAAQETYFAVTPDGLLVWDYDGWAGIWFVLGGLQLLVGLGILAGKQWARVAGVILLMLVATGQIAFLAAFPLWAVLTIAIAVVAINALVVHGESFGATAERAPRH